MVVVKGHSLTMPLDLDSDVREKFLSSSCNQDVSKKFAKAEGYVGLSYATAAGLLSCLNGRPDCSFNGSSAKVDCHDSESAPGTASPNEKSGNRHPSLANNGLDSNQAGLIGQEEDSDGSGGTRTPELLCSAPNGSACQDRDCPDTLEGHSRGEQSERHQGQDNVGEGFRSRKVNSKNCLSKGSGSRKGKSKKSDDPTSNEQTSNAKGQMESKGKKSSGLRVQFSNPWVFGFWRKNTEVQKEDELSADSGFSGGSVNNGHSGEWCDAKKTKNKSAKSSSGPSDVNDALLEENVTLQSSQTKDKPTVSGVKTTGKYELISDCITAPPNNESVQVKCATEVADRVDNLSALVGSINGAVGPPVFGDSPPEDHEVAMSAHVIRSPAYTVFLPPSSMYLDCPSREGFSSTSHGTCASDMPLLSPKDLSMSDSKHRSPLLPSRSHMHRRSSSMELSSIPRPGQLYQPHPSKGEGSQTSQDTVSSRRSGSSRRFEDEERPPEVSLQMPNGLEDNDDHLSRRGTRRIPAHIFSLKHLCSDRTHDPEPQGMPPDYVKIAVILLLPALPCALPALIWALKARRSCRLGEYTAAWQNSHRAFFCCFAALVGFAMLLLAIMVLTYTRNCNCGTVTNHILTSPQIFDLDKPTVFSPIQGANEMKKFAQNAHGLQGNGIIGSQHITFDNSHLNLSSIRNNYDPEDTFIHLAEKGLPP